MPFWNGGGISFNLTQVVSLKNWKGFLQTIQTIQTNEKVYMALKMIK
jgi:hypothetical protein